MLTWVMLQQPQEKCYSVLYHTKSVCKRVCGDISVDLGLATAAARAALPSPTSVCDVLVLTWVRLQQPQEQRYPVLPVCVMF